MFDPLLFLISIGGQPVERYFKACICTNPKGKPVVYDENPEKSQVWYKLMCFPNLQLQLTSVTDSVAFVIVTVKWKGSLDCCSPKEENYDLEWETRLDNQKMDQKMDRSFRCSSRMLGRVCL